MSGSCSIQDGVKSDNSARANSAAGITLFAFPKPSTRPSGSGFCQKLESYLRFAGVKYSQVDANTFTAPKGKLPYIRDEQNGATVADSHFIIRYLAENGYAEILDGAAGLTSLEKAEAHAWRCLWEDHVYPAMTYTRWLIPENSNIFIQEELASIPWPLRSAVGTLAWYNIRSALRGHGVGRHSVEEVSQQVSEAVENLEIKLKGTRTGITEHDMWFFPGKGPSELDAALHGILITVATTPSTPLVVDLISKSPAVRQYLLGISETYFPEYVDVIAKLRTAVGQ